MAFRTQGIRDKSEIIRDAKTGELHLTEAEEAIYQDDWCSRWRVAHCSTLNPTFHGWKIFHAPLRTASELLPCLRRHNLGHDDGKAGGRDRTPFGSAAAIR